jgi:hypothetical protein
MSFSSLVWRYIIHLPRSNRIAIIAHQQLFPALLLFGNHPTGCFIIAPVNSVGVNVLRNAG